MTTRDRTIRQETEADRRARLCAAVDRVLAEPNGDKKVKLFHVAVNASIKVAHDRGDLADWLGRAYDWIEHHPDVPDVMDREDVWLERLTQYERLSDAIAYAEERL